MAAKLINRREPLLVTGPFKFWRREYAVGDILDRRRVKMRHRQMVKLIDTGKLALCREMDPEKLLEYGYIYDNSIGRYPLLTEEDYEKLKSPNEPEDQLEDGDDYSADATTKHVGGGWYDVMVEGKVINEKSLRRDDAEEFVRDYNSNE